MLTQTPSRTPLLAVLAALLVALAVLVVTSNSVNASGGTFGRTSVRCWPSEVVINIDHIGAYDGQWGAQRILTWTWIPSDGWIYVGATDWEVVRLTGPNTGIVGGNLSLNVGAGLYISHVTQVMYWNGSSWGPVQRHDASHFQGQNPIAGTYCQT